MGNDNGSGIPIVFAVNKGMFIENIRQIVVVVVVNVSSIRFDHVMIIE